MVGFNIWRERYLSMTFENPRMPLAYSSWLENKQMAFPLNDLTKEVNFGGYSLWNDVKEWRLFAMSYSPYVICQANTCMAANFQHSDQAEKVTRPYSDGIANFALNALFCICANGVKYLSQFNFFHVSRH